jgi:Ca2+-binding EF-hand superfamily protein
MAYKHMKSPLIGLALAGLTALPANASSVEPGKTSRWFQEIDADANGTITLQEFLQKRGEQFVRLDANANKSVTMNEYANARTSIRRFLDLDANGDSEVTLDEFLIPSRTRFRHFDANGDGKVSRTEIDLFRERMRAQYEMRKRHAATQSPSGFRLAKLASLQDEE